MFNSEKPGQDDEKVEKVEPVDPGRRNFMIGAAAALGGSLINPEAAARSEKIEQTYIGFEPTPHDRRVVDLNIKRLVPDAVSVQIIYQTNGQHAVLKIDILKDNGKTIESGVPVGVNFPVSSYLSGLFKNLENELK